MGERHRNIKIFPFVLRVWFLHLAKIGNFLNEFPVELNNPIWYKRSPMDTLIKKQNKHMCPF